MARPKQDIIKNKVFIIRVEPYLKKLYTTFCKKNKYTPSKRIRQFITDEMK